MSSWPWGHAAVRRTAGTYVLLAMALPTAALAAWPDRPTRDQLIEFANAVDSVAVWSIALPDSVAVGTRRDAAVLDVAPVRSRVIRSRGWGRDFAAVLFRRDGSGDHCRCDLVRDDHDAAEVVVAVAEFFVAKETMWVPVVLRDSCAQVFLAQGPWGGIPIRDNWAALLRLIRGALPTDSAFASDSVPPHARSIARPVDIDVDELPAVIHKVSPQYPEVARSLGLSGTVSVLALVGTDGVVRDTRISWSIPYLDDSAVEAVRHWRFKPARSRGTPVAVWVMTPIQFTLR